MCLSRSLSACVHRSLSVCVYWSRGMCLCRFFSVSLYESVIKIRHELNPIFMNIYRILYIYVHVYTYQNTLTYTYICHIHTYTYMYVCMHGSFCVSYVYIQNPKYIRTCVYIQQYTPVHTHTYTHGSLLLWVLCHSTGFARLV